MHPKTVVIRIAKKEHLFYSSMVMRSKKDDIRNRLVADMSPVIWQWICIQQPLAGPSIFLTEILC